ncbi:nitric-oxide reductase large subunit [Neisseria weaveri]|uniref:Nitric oxide reductase n=1 Tax=Neisseria weaveri TaxID=28091 RepID=A0A3S5B3C9_9NEIS|nr:nitric-oxide reductase large subunit [Neisseria weaveri]EGV38901.1 nitric oxide reductase [Neisseria weaveri LMG 5135]VEJ50237.1 nitric oxide reductase [Neisseria weaveri]
MGQYKKLWFMLLAVLLTTFTILGYMGSEVYKKAPPYPEKFVTSSGETFISKDDILAGQTAWQTTGGMEVGSILGHGAYQAPDWTADWLHRELVAWLDITAQQEHGKKFDELNHEQQAVLKARLSDEYREKGRVRDDGTVLLSDTRVKAIEAVAPYYITLYGDDPSMVTTREHFAMKNNTLPSEEARKKLTNFFFWTAWSASANRPGETFTYTNNWPHEPLINNVPTTENYVWSFTSIVLLLAGIGLLMWGYSFLTKHEEVQAPTEDPLSKFQLTPSQKALGKYVFLTVALFVAQVLLGGVTAHYTVEGQHFYGINISDWFPYALVRTWHIQSAIFWIATGFLTAGLFLAPIVNGGKDPKFQRAGVNFLYIALFIVVVGSYGGNFLALSHAIPSHLNFWFGHQGYEYLDLGRFWQILLMVGLLLWLFLMLRCTVNAFKEKGTDKNLLAIFVASMVGVGVFYAPGLFYGEHSPIAVMEYWRWWVVHLWVEGFFEVFATASFAFIFYNMGFIRRTTATAATLASAAIFMLGGVPGTLHHLYFTGTTSAAMAIGACFSALEVVPLILLGREAYEHWSYQNAAPWAKRLRWPLMCFVAVAFWNMVGAGVFGFMINPPISLFYIQGLNTTAVHAHAALFGVYGFLALGFVLLVAGYLKPQAQFDEKLMTWAFWLLNGGLAGMIVMSLLPVGIIQTYASITHGLWYARSEEFMQIEILDTLRWIRTAADLVFIGGAVCIAWQATKMVFSRNK